jgi:PPK2 family polyphosphate:nucleotide phosphotransferase
MAKPSMRDLLRAPQEGLDLSTIDTAATPGFSGNKRDGVQQQASLAPRLAELQERLYAEGRGGGQRSVLLVLQGMDGAGKGGTVKHVVGQVDPMGVGYTAFKAPTKEEREHDFLWRIRKATPEPGMLGVFDRSHYEDVGIVRVHDLVTKRVWSRRYDTINRFEERLVLGGTTVVKCFLHISKQEQKKRLLARLDDPTKQWKYNPADVDERLLWDEYQVAYTDAIIRCNSEVAPWYVVPADRKWWRNLAITGLLIEALEAMSPQYPSPAFDLDAERRRVLEA